jgi:hypothetical protein
MRIVDLFAVISIAVFAVAAEAQIAPPPAPQQPAATAPQPAWTDHAPDPARVNRAGIAVPREAGSLKMTEVRDYGTEGLDDVAQYASADQAISGTIFIYYPTLADTGLTFLATDETIRRRFGPATRVADDRLVTIGGVARAGRRIIYEGASDGARSTGAIFVRAGDWIMVLRVSGPHSRAAEIAADIDALAAGLSFGRGSNPVPAHVIATENCPAGEDPEAPVAKPTAPEATMLVLLGGTGEVRDRKGKTYPDLIGRVPDRLCLARSSARGEAVLLTYRTVVKPTGIYVPKLFQLVGDAGYILEATAASDRPDHVIVVRHGIGRLSIFGMFEGTPSLSQIDRLLDGDASVPILAKATLKPEGANDINLFCDQFREGCGKPDGQNGGREAPAPAPH